MDPPISSFSGGNSICIEVLFNFLYAQAMLRENFPVQKDHPPENELMVSALHRALEKLLSM